MQKIRDIPKTLSVGEKGYNLCIKNHKITVYQICYEDFEDDKSLFGFTAACISRKKTGILEEMQIQGLDIDILAETCISEIKNNEYVLLNAVERHRPVYNPDYLSQSGEYLELDCNGENIKGQIHQDYVSKKVIPVEKFNEAWYLTDVSGYSFEKWMQENGTDVKTACIDVLRKSKTYEQLQDKLFLIITGFGKRWSDYKTDHIRKAFAEQLEEQQIKTDGS